MRLESLAVAPVLIGASTAAGARNLGRGKASTARSSAKARKVGTKALAPSQPTIRPVRAAVTVYPTVPQARMKPKSVPRRCVILSVAASITGTNAPDGTV